MTRQISDTLLFEDKKHLLNTEILEVFFKNNAQKRPKIEIMCSALWRGYIASFEIVNGELQISDVRWLMDINFRMESKLNDLFLNKKADWYSGLIRIDDFGGEFDIEPENGIFEYLEILNGNFVKRLKFNYTELQKFKEEQYQYFIISDDVEPIYELFRKNNVSGLVNEDSVNTIIKKHIMRYTTKVYVS
jgi:hypothetical protein